MSAELQAAFQEVLLGEPVFFDVGTAKLLDVVRLKEALRLHTSFFGHEKAKADKFEAAMEAYEKKEPAEWFDMTAENIKMELLLK